ncbi:Hypothetical predicted protein [Pelobates cultripes]|uniref:Uncharacterized protein n=1 Tax=Pelobates cultripes TaxID=61616 RepID=A0AAD1SV68_PELCU|nr:Hypothetical predicted protein [Pelobates cultripes]
MGRTKRPDGSQTPRSNLTSSQAGPMDDYLQAPATASREQAGSTMADSPHHVQPPETAGPTLTDISADIRALAAQMVTKTDLQALSDDLHVAIRLEVTALRAEMTAHSGRLQTLEGNMQEAMGRTGTTTTAVTRQGNMLLALRRQTEDLDNRGRRSNIRVRGLPEPQAEEDIEATLKALFQAILGEDLPADLTFDRAHRANRPRIPDGTPRDAICCLHHYKHKERIMRKARTRPLWRFRGADVALHQNEWVSLRWPEESPGFLHHLELPPTEIMDWILGQLEQRPRPPTLRPQRRRRGDSPRRPTARRHLDPAEPEE